MFFYHNIPTDIETGVTETYFIIIILNDFDGEMK